MKIINKLDSAISRYRMQNNGELPIAILVSEAEMNDLMMVLLNYNPSTSEISRDKTTYNGIKILHKDKVISL